MKLDDETRAEINAALRIIKEDNTASRVRAVMEEYGFKKPTPDEGEKEGEKEDEKEDVENGDTESGEVEPPPKVAKPEKPKRKSLYWGAQI